MTQNGPEYLLSLRSDRKTDVSYACGKEQEHLTAESGGSLLPTEKSESSTINHSRPFSLLAENLPFSSVLTLNHSGTPGVLLHQIVIPSQAVQQQQPYSLSYQERKQKILFLRDLLRGNLRVTKNAT